VNSTVKLEIVHIDDDLVVVDKPSGMHVHQPEHPHRRVPREWTCLYAVRKQIERYLFPVHRLDVATSGLLMFALNETSARDLSYLFQNGLIEKTYTAIVRGFVADEGLMDESLTLDSTGEPAEAQTEYRCLQRFELPVAVGKRHSSARYSLVEVKPKTGRYHQIRRHFARQSHPIIGDREHGDSHHNRFFREQLGLPGLWLRAQKLKFNSASREKIDLFVAPASRQWDHATSILSSPAAAIRTTPENQS